MLFEDSNRSSAITWVREDLDECLETIRENLEGFSEDTSQREPLRIVQDILERLNLTFLTMEQEGARILTDEMIAVGGHMLHNGKANQAESLNALTDAVIVLPSYLDRLQAGHGDLPILLLPTLNELRATYDETLLSEGTLFAPDLDQIIPELSGSEADAIQASEFTTWARRTRSQYQAALLGWLQEQSRDQLLTPMQEVCEKLYIRLGRNDLRRLWWIAQLILKGLQDKSVDNDLPLRRLFARLDLTLKAMAEKGESGPAGDTVIALSRALLFHAAQARPGSNSTDTLRKRFQLETLIPDREALMRARGAVTGRDAALFRSIGDAIRDELGQVKDTLDMELRTGRVDLGQREQSLTTLQQLADTLNMLNLPVPAKAVEDLLPTLREADGETSMDLDSPLLALAQKLLQVESILDAHIRLLGEPIEDTPSDGLINLPPHEQNQMIRHVLAECIHSLHQAQDGIRNYLNGVDDADYSTPLGQIAGALHVSSQDQIASLTEKLVRALNAGLSGEGKKENSHLEPLTDAVAALELYLAGCRDGQSNSLRFLEIMHSRLDGLPEASDSGEELQETIVELPQPAREKPKVTETAAAGDSPIDPAMLGIFLEEFDSVVRTLAQVLPAWLENTSDQRALSELRRAFHTLKGSGRMVGALEVGDFSWRVEELINQLMEKRVSVNPSVRQGLILSTGVLSHLRSRLLGEDNELDASGVKSLENFIRDTGVGIEPLVTTLTDSLPPALMAMVLETPESMAQSEQEQSMPAEADKSAASVDAEKDAATSVDPTLAKLIITEVEQYLSTLESFLSVLISGKAHAVNSELVRAVHTLAGNFSIAPLGQEADVARALEKYLARSLQRSVTVKPAVGQTIQTILHRFHQRLAILKGANQTSYPLQDTELLQEIEGLTTSEAPVESADSVDAPVRTAGTQPVPAVGDDADQTRQSAESAVFRIEEGSIISIFLEEATEVLERCDTLLNTWRDKLSDQKLVQNLQREIHTFKGGARMAELDALGDLSHAMESLMERITTNRLQATVAAVQALEEGCDRLTAWVEQLQSGSMPDAGTALQRFEQQVSKLSARAPDQQDTEEETSEDFILPGSLTDVSEPDREHEPTAAADSVEPAQTADTAVPEPISRETKKADTRKEPDREFREIKDRPAAATDQAEDGSSQAHIRVAAELMDNLVNYAGEVSIYRSRLEQQLGSVRFNLKEVEATITRLSEQLRKMDIETEAQMMSRYQSASNQSSTEFDPLELDRFSNIQQLSRSLTESVSDLANLQNMLGDSVQQAESLLTQQSRVSADLQAGLMQTRMTPFGSAAPRLRRVVRSAAIETGKQARLHLRMAGSSDQLDRNVLERITAPLEHMLRNAVAHGIETPRQRLKQKKPEEGQITVTVEAEATEFVIRVSDDGAGIDLNAVRDRAVERGMIRKDEEVDPRRLVEFIRDSGFSTARTVTGLAGRGVGMDVVNSEIKQIGGSLEIQSEPGSGTRFTIRIPFSLAVMQAIGVSVNERPFLIPLNSVAGVARMTPGEYSKLAASESPEYEFAGENFPLLELEPLLGASPSPLGRENVSLMMIRSGESKAAFRVSGMQGHQEVVIKPVGPQISSIPGILGGTIAADGQVVIILDMGPLIRIGQDEALKPVTAEVKPQKKARQPLVMVVDDSITMRKVTSRVLEKHAIEVMTAQDGLDAIERLHERIPDLILLDIEMPRMDGYELAQHIRSDARLRHIPIVMITSRAGQKHRKKARESGANAYLTKPYQEADLLVEVGQILKLDLATGRPD